MTNIAYMCIVHLWSVLQFIFFGLRSTSRWQLRVRPCAKRFDPYEMIHRVIRLSGVIRRTIYAPSISSIPSHELACRFFAPEKGFLSVALTCVCTSAVRSTLQVFGEFCGSADTCAALLCFATPRQGPPSRNQEPHKLLCDSQNASHSHLTCDVKVSQPMKGSLADRL